jgi:hypothetical protein
MSRPYDSSLIAYDAAIPYDSGISAWAEHARRTSRTPVWVVEVDLDYYDDVAIPATNSDGSLSYRTPATTDGTWTVKKKTRRWTTHTQRPIPTLPAIPCVVSASLGGEEVKIGQGLGYFGQASIELIDFMDDDRRSEDPFASDASRSGLDPNAGTYFGKLLARNPYWTGRTIRIMEGWTTDGVFSIADAITHTFFIRDVQGPSDGRLKISAVGPLQQISLEEQEIPSPSTGVLLSDIDAVVTTATLADAAIAGDYAATGMARIGDEVVEFTRSGAVLTIARGQLGTVANSHKAGDAVQECLVYSGVNVIDIIYDILASAGVEASLMDLVGWQEEGRRYLAAYDFSAVLGTPTKAIDLVRELLEASGLILWWDDLQSLIRLKSIRTSLSAIATWTDNLHLIDRPAIKSDISQRISRTDVLMDLRSPILDPRNASSYRARLIGIEIGAEAIKHGKSQLKLLPSRWIQSTRLDIAERTSYQTTSFLRNGRKTIDLKVAAKDASAKIGDCVAVKSRDLVDRTGAPAIVKCLVCKRSIVSPGSVYSYGLEQFPDEGRLSYIVDDSTPEYLLASAEQRSPGAFICGEGGAGPDPSTPTDPPYLIGY